MFVVIRAKNKKRQGREKHNFGMLLWEDDGMRATALDDIGAMYFAM